MDAWTPLGALIVSVILLPVVGALWYTKASTGDIDAVVKESAHLREWLKSHQATDEEAFKEFRKSLERLSGQIQHNFEVLVTEIRKAQ